MCFISTSAGLTPKNGGWPVNISYNSAPSA
jgi:hypothetical protein